MSTAILMCALFFAKVVDNALSTTKTILVQRNHCILAGIALATSNFIYLCITKNVVNSDSSLALIVVSVASGVGCCLAVAVSSRLSKEKTYVNVIMSDDKEEMQGLRDFLAQHHITNTATDSYCIESMNGNEELKLRRQGEKTFRAINVGCMMPYMNYEPRTLKEILGAFEEVQV